MSQQQESRKFVPYITTVDLNTARFRFFHATPEAREWYDPLKSYARLEYDWVLENVPLAGRNFLDAGAHHGQYAVAVGAAYPDCRVVSVDPLQENLDITEVNMRLNGMAPVLERCVVSAVEGEVRFTDPNGLPGSNGRIVDEGGLAVPSRRLVSIMPDAHVIKLDVEGEEYRIIPDQIDEMGLADTWIVEVHPFSSQARNTHPDVLIEEFTRRGFEVLWVNRDDNRVEPYVPGTRWDIHSTIFAVRRQSAVKERIMARTLATVLFDITNRCNLNCIFCQRKKFAPQFMSTETFRTILEKIAPEVNNFLLSCAWEYSTHPEPHRLVGMLGEFDLPHTIMFSNGNVLSDSTLDAVMAAGIGKYVFSINEATPETYVHVRPGGRFERVVGNIRRMVAAKGRNGSGPVVAVNMTLLKSNIEELPDFVSLAADLGVQVISGRHLILNRGLDMQRELVADLERADALIDEAKAKCLAAGISFDVPKYTEPAPAAKACTAAWNQWHVSSNGDVSICPRIHRHVSIGNIAQQSFSEIYEGDRAKSLRGEFGTRQFSNPVCALCLDNKENEIEIDQGF